MIKGLGASILEIPSASLWELRKCKARSEEHWLCTLVPAHPAGSAPPLEEPPWVWSRRRPASEARAETRSHWRCQDVKDDCQRTSWGYHEDNLSTKTFLNFIWWSHGLKCIHIWKYFHEVIMVHERAPSHQKGCLRNTARKGCLWASTDQTS